VTGALTGQITVRHAAQFLVNEDDQLVQRGFIALPPGQQQKAVASAAMAPPAPGLLLGRYQYNHPNVFSGAFVVLVAAFRLSGIDPEATG